MRIAQQQVIARSAQQRIALGTAEHDVFSAAAVKGVTAFFAAQPIAPLAAGRGFAQVAVAPVGPKKGVVAAAAQDDVRTSPPPGHVVVGLIDVGVVSVEAGTDELPTAPTHNIVVSAVGADVIGQPFAGDDHVAVAAARERVALGTPADRNARFRCLTRVDVVINGRFGIKVERPPLFGGFGAQGDS